MCTGVVRTLPHEMCIVTSVTQLHTDNDLFMFADHRTRFDSVYVVYCTTLHIVIVELQQKAEVT